MSEEEKLDRAEATLLGFIFGYGVSGVLGTPLVWWISGHVSFDDWLKIAFVIAGLPPLIGAITNRLRWDWKHK